MAEDFTGPVDFGTMLQMQGAMQVERAAARAYSAGASETVKAAYMRSAETKGALAAQNIRQRYFKKEFEQVLDTRVKPLQERLAAAQDKRNQIMATTVMPVNRMVTPEEYQQRADLLGQGGLPKLQTIPVPSSKEKGTQVQEVIPQQAAAPNAALGKQIGAMESQEVLAIVDPVSGQPVPLASPRGISVMQKADNDFWGEYSAVNQELMQIMSEYPGNPYTNNYAKSLIDSAIKQANIATTGKTNPQDAQKWMEDRQQFEAEQDLKQQQLYAGGFKIQTAEAGLDVATREAQQILQQDPSFKTLLGKTINDKINTGQSFTRREKFEVSNAVQTYRDLQEKELARKQRRLASEPKRFRISSDAVPYPGTWSSEMRGYDPVYKQYFGEAYANAVNSRLAAISKLPAAEQEKTLKEMGASPDDITMFVQGKGTITPSLKNLFEQQANMEGVYTQANDIAMIRRLPELERQQPELSSIIDQTINDAINQMRAEGRIPDAEKLRTDRYRSFFELVYGREAPKVYDRPTYQKVFNLLETRKLQDQIKYLENLQQEIPETRPEVPVEEMPVSTGEVKPTIGSVDTNQQSLGLTLEEKPFIRSTEPLLSTPVFSKRTLSFLTKPFLGEKIEKSRKPAKQLSEKLAAKYLSPSK